MKLIQDNKKAFFDYFIEDKYEAGIVLTGSEIKSIRLGNVNLKDTYVQIKNGEIFIINMHIAQYDKTTDVKVDTRRIRKLLLNKSEITKLERQIKIKGYTIIPTKLYLKNRVAKLEIATAKGKQLFDKRRAIAEKDQIRDMERQRNEAQTR